MYFTIDKSTNLVNCVGYHLSLFADVAAVPGPAVALPRGPVRPGAGVRGRAGAVPRRAPRPRLRPPPPAARRPRPRPLNRRSKNYKCYVIYDRSSPVPI